MVWGCLMEARRFMWLEHLLSQLWHIQTMKHSMEICWSHTILFRTIISTKRVQAIIHDHVRLISMTYQLTHNLFMLCDHRHWLCVNCESLNHRTNQWKYISKIRHFKWFEASFKWVIEMTISWRECDGSKPIDIGLFWYEEGTRLDSQVQTWNSYMRTSTWMSCEFVCNV